jgi:Flp pilus assembly protein TadG
MIFRHIPIFALSLRSLRNRFRKGVMAVEFAVLAPVFFMLFTGLIETSLIMLVQHLLENATYNASRLAKTGYADGERTQLETIMDVLVREMGSLNPLIDVARLNFSSAVYDDPTGIGDPEEGEEGLGTGGQYVVFTVSYPWHVFTPLIGDIIADQNGIIRLSSRIVVRNEPY